MKGRLIAMLKEADVFQVLFQMNQLYLIVAYAWFLVRIEEFIETNGGFIKSLDK